jgi:hypothetical protein
LEIKYIRQGIGYYEAVCDECVEEEPSMEEELVTIE